MKNKIITTVAKKTYSFGLFLNKNAGRIAACMMVCLMIMAMGSMVFAADPETTESATTVDADAMWGNMTNLIVKWISRIGGLAMLIGGIMFGLGLHGNDPTQKLTGGLTFAGGAFVIAVAQAAGTFMA